MKIRDDGKKAQREQIITLNRQGINRARCRTLRDARGLTIEMCLKKMKKKLDHHFEPSNTFN